MALTARMALTAPKVPRVTRVIQGPPAPPVQKATQVIPVPLGLRRRSPSSLRPPAVETRSPSIAVPAITPSTVVPESAWASRVTRRPAAGRSLRTAPPIRATGRPSSSRARPGTARSRSAQRTDQLGSGAAGSSRPSRDPVDRRGPLRSDMSRSQAPRTRRAFAHTTGAPTGSLGVRVTSDNREVSRGCDDDIQGSQGGEAAHRR